MSTRALFTFTDERTTVDVYKHSDGYPKGALKAIEKAFDYSWMLPRFEADEFAASFVAANKKPNEGSSHLGGGIRLMNSNDIPGDIEFQYVVSYSGDLDLDVRIAEVTWPEDRMRTDTVFDGKLAEAIMKYC